MSMSNAQLILNGLSGEHAQQLGKELQANQEASPSIQAHAKYLQEVIEGRMSPQEAALRAKIEQQMQGGGGGTIGSTNPYPTAEPVSGTNGVSVSASVDNATPKNLRMGPTTSVATGGAMKEQSRSKMTNRDASTIIPSLTSVAERSISARGAGQTRDFEKEIKMRGEEARKTEAVKQEGKKADLEARIQMHADRITLDDKALEANIKLGYARINAMLSIAKKKLEFFRESTNENDKVAAAKAILQEVDDLQQYNARLTQNTEFGSNEDLDGAFTKTLGAIQNLKNDERYKEAKDFLFKKATGKTPPSTNKSGAKIETGGQNVTAPKDELKKQLGTKTGE